jgi:hypothetical protein
VWLSAPHRPIACSVKAPGIVRDFAFKPLTQTSFFELVFRNAKCQKIFLVFFASGQKKSPEAKPPGLGSVPQ